MCFKAAVRGLTLTHMAETVRSSCTLYAFPRPWWGFVLAFEPQRGHCTQTIMNLTQDSAYCTAGTNTSRDFHHLKHAACDDFPLL